MYEVVEFTVMAVPNTTKWHKTLGRFVFSRRYDVPIDPQRPFMTFKLTFSASDGRILRKHVNLNTDTD